MAKTVNFRLCPPPSGKARDYNEESDGAERIQTHVIPFVPPSVRETELCSCLLLVLLIKLDSKERAAGCDLDELLPPDTLTTNREA